MPSSSNSPLWGPIQPRIPRKREKRNYTQIRKMGIQSRNGLTLVEAPWLYSVTRPIFANVERITDTYRNPKFAAFRPKVYFDDGGPLLIEKSKWQFNDVNLMTPWAYHNRLSYGLNVILGGSHGLFNMASEYPPLEDTTVSSFHAQAYKVLRPDKPAVSLLNSFIELKDLFHVTFDAIRNIKDIANYWLATSFGWAPLLTDIYKMYKAVQNLDDRLRFFIRNNGVPIRAKKKVWSSSNSSVLYDSTNCGINRNTWVDFPGRTSLSSSWRHSISWTYQREVWASARFVYWMKDLELPSRRKFVEMGLLGLNPTPAAVWNALPWTWLIDWFANIGDILDNMSSSMGNRLVAQSFYVMGQTNRSYEWHGTDGYFTCSATHSFETKVREIGHPYGLAFGAALSPFQFSILAALGAQRF